MLESLRKGASTWAAKLLLGILVVSFAIWGIADQIVGGGNGNDVLTAGGTTVSALEYRLAYDRRIAELSRQFGTRLTREQATALGVDQQVLSQIAAGAVLDETARKIGLGVSKDKLAELAASDPAFRGADGRFDRTRFELVLQQVGMRPADYLREREQAAVRQQIIEAVAGGLSVPDELLSSIARYRGEDRTVEYIPLPRSMVEPIDPPEEAVLETWFEEHKADYAAPEYRTINYVKLEAEDIADPSVISDEQVRSYYESHRDRYTTPEKRTIEQINFATEEEANAAREGMRTGTTFEDLVQRQGKTLQDVNLGSLTRAEISDQALAEAAFSLEENQVSNVVQGAFGPVILRVTEITPETVTPIAQVQEQIRKELALDEANKVLLDTYDAYEDARAAGDTLEEAAQKLNLTMRTIDAVDQSGRRPDGTAVSDVPSLSSLLDEAFKIEVGVENPPINLPGNGFLFYEVSDITPARDRTLDEVRDKVVADWTDAEAAKRLSARAEALQKELKDGKTLDQVAAEIGQEKTVKRGLKREADDPDLGRAGVAAVFGVPKGGTGAFANPAGDGVFLFQVTEVFQPAASTPDSVPEEITSALGQSMENDLLDQLIARLQMEHGVTVNRSAIQQALNF